MAHGEHKPVKGSHTTYFKTWDPAKRKKANPRHRIQVKLILKSEENMQDLHIPRHLSLKKRREMFARHLGDHDDHIKTVRQFARKFRLRIEKVSKDHGSVTLSGTVAAINKAFKVDLHHHETEHHQTGDTHHLLGHEGEAHLPDELHAFVESIIGLNKPPATHQVPGAATGQICAAKGLTSAWFAEHYNFPAEFRGKGQRIAIISCGGGFRQKDFNAYFRQAGFRTVPKVKYVSLDGTRNTAGVNAAGDYELYTDCMVAACAAPEAKITVVSVENSIFGFADGVEYLSGLGARSPHVISYSWGASEDKYSKLDVQGVNRKLQYAAQVSQISIFCATGDFGSTNEMKNEEDTKLAVQYPAGSPWVTGCGGTMFELSSTGKVRKEVVWNATYLYNLMVQNASGGGFSKMNKRPGFQKGAVNGDYPRWTKSKRGVPDVSAHANITANNVSYWILMQGQKWVTGGTSSAAPLWAALTARLNEALDTRLGFFNPLLYEMADSGALKSITEGSNTMPNGPEGWDAAEGWDPCTGLGVPNGVKMLKWLKKNLN